MMEGLGRLLFSQPVTKDKVGRFAMADQDYGRYSGITIWPDIERKPGFRVQLI